jgi:hypothetical protein
MFIADLGRRLRLQPEIESIAIASETPTSGAMGFQVSVPGVVPPDGRPLFEVLGNTVTSAYFATLGISVLAGRDFTDLDTASAPRVVIVTEKTVRRFWPSRPRSEAVGQQLWLQPNLIDPRNPNRSQSLIPMTIVGVVGDARSGTTRHSYIYLPIQQQYGSAIKILARARDDRRAISCVREQLRAMDRRVPVLSAGALEDEASPATIQLRISATIAGSLGIVGLLLAAIGVYGVTSYVVARRTREIGIRVALGADSAAVVRMAMGEAAYLLAIGALAGLMLAAAAARVLRGVQLGIVAADPVPFSAALLIFALVGLAASYMPVRR